MGTDHHERHRRRPSPPAEAPHAPTGEASPQAAVAADAGRFEIIPHEVLASPGVLVANPRTLHFVLALLATGPNGLLRPTLAALRPFGFRSKSAIAKHIDDALACGLLVPTRVGLHQQVARLFAVTWRPLHASAPGEDREAHLGAFMTPSKTLHRAPPSGPQARRPAGQDRPAQRSTCAPLSGPPRPAQRSACAPPSGVCMTRPAGEQYESGRMVCPDSDAMPVSDPLVLRFLDLDGQMQ